MNDIVAASSFVTGLNEAASRFSSQLNAGARSGGPHAWLDAFSALSDFDQQRVRIGMGWDQKSASVEDLKLQLKAAGVEPLGLHEALQGGVLRAHPGPGLDPLRLALDRRLGVAHLETEQLAAFGHGGGTHPASLRR